MTKPRESSIERKVCERAKGRGWLVFKWASPNHRGVPDRIFVKGGRVVFVEFKAPGRGLTRLQDHVRRQLEGEGVEYRVVDSVEDGDAALT